jgi:signal transduction histidine kinase
MLQPFHHAAALDYMGFDPCHVVQFYETERFLSGAVVDFLAAGLAAGQSGVAIATAAHRDAFVAGLRRRDIDVDRVLANGRLTLLDARETIDSIMNGPLPDPIAFRRMLGRVLTTAELRGSHPCSRAYGEMVDVLWKDGNADAAIRLEELWNALSIEHPLALMCAYAMGNFSTEADGKQFVDVCRYHSHVVPTEKYMHAADHDARLREITILQQRAQALEHELARRQELEEALRNALTREREARAEAEQANRVKDDFLAVLSHELRTPLNAILGWSQIMKAGRDAETIARGLDVIARNADLQRRLIDDLLDVSHIMRGQMQIDRKEVDLIATVKATADSVAPSAAAKGILFDLQIEPSSAIVCGDAARLHQIVWNLLSNAIKFTPASGRVTLALSSSRSHARIAVSDTGHGIRADFLPYVFDQFRQEDLSPTRTHGGLGLGLAVVRHLVEAHGGTVSAESTGEGYGAAFTVILPLRDGAEAAEKNRPPASRWIS